MIFALLITIVGDVLVCWLLLFCTALDGIGFAAVILSLYDGMSLAKGI